MSPILITTPFEVFTDVDGTPLDSGYIYVGTVNLDPVTNPISVYWDSALSIPASQPIRTINGYPSRSGSPGKLYANSDYSITVKDRNGRLVYATSTPNPLSSFISDLANTSNPALGDYLVGVKSVLTGGVARTQHDKNADYISARDFGAVGDGVTDDTAALAAALAATVGKALYIPAGNYLVTSDLVCNGVQSIIGDGSYKTRLTFTPSGPGALLTITAGTDQTIVGLIRGIGLYTTDTTFFKVALDLSDISSWIIDDIYIHGAGSGTPGAPYWKGANSIGLRTNGRETSSFSNLRICAEKPIVIAANPNTLPADNEEADHFHFYNCYLVGLDNYCVTVNSGFGVSNLVFDGFQAWVGGIGGFFLDDTRPGGAYIASRSIVLRNIRTEQQNTGLAGGYTQPSTNWAVYLSAATEVQTVSIEDCVFGNYSKGIYANKVSQLHLKNVVMAINGRALEMDGTQAGTVLEMHNCYWDPLGTYRLVNMVPSRISAYATGSYSFPSSATYVFTSPAPYSNWVVVGKNAASASCPADTNENTLATVTIKANTMGPYGCAKVWTLWRMSNNANAKTARIRFGGASGTDYLGGLDVSGGSLTVAECRIYNQNNPSAQVGTGQAPGFITTGSAVSSAIDTTADTTVVITGQKGTAGDDLTLIAYTVEVAAG